MYTAADTPQGPPVLPAGHRLLWGPPGASPALCDTGWASALPAARGPSSRQPQSEDPGALTAAWWAVNGARLQTQQLCAPGKYTDHSRKRETQPGLTVSTADFGRGSAWESPDGNAFGAMWEEF